MRVKNLNMIPAGSVSISANATLEEVCVEHISDYSIQLVFSGTAPTGTFSLQYSNDDVDPTNWTDDSDSEQDITAGGNLMWNVENAGYKWVRVKYARTSGTGNITVARCQIKGV